MKTEMVRTKTNIQKIALYLLGILSSPLALGGVGGGLLSACSDWDDHYEATAAAEGSNLTLWQQMSEEPQLSDFRQVLEQTKVFRMHKKTPVSYADLLDAGQSFTVVAPVNGTFNRDSLLQLVQTAQGDSMVEKNFVKNHLSRTLVSVSPEEQTMRLMNDKYVSVGNGQIEGISMSAPNKHAKNGVLHVAGQPLPYTRSLYEALCDLPQFAAIGRQLRQYEEDYFDADASVSSGIVEGVPVYVDSVVTEYNKMLAYIDYIDSEDSLFWVAVPGADGWEKAWNEASTYFNYDQKVLKRDSLQQFWTTRALLDDAVFNTTDQLSPRDSIVSVRYRAEHTGVTTGKPVFHVFKQPFSSGGILDGARQLACSNGLIYQTAEWPFTPQQTYFRELWSEGENTSLITAEKDCSYNIRRVVADSISEGAYLQIVPRTSTSNWELTFRINNTLSGDYDICAVVLPKSVADQVNPNLRPCKFRATIGYVDEFGVSQTNNCGNKQFTSNPLQTDTIMLAEAFHFPACNYGQTEIKVTVKLTCSILARETSQYAREMYLDCIYLRPRTSKSEEQ